MSEFAKLATLTDEVQTVIEAVAKVQPSATKQASTRAELYRALESKCQFLAEQAEATLARKAAKPATQPAQKAKLTLSK